MIGKTLGHFAIEERIGAGGMGEVYRARDTRLDRVVAIKILPQELASGPARERLKREARTVSQLNHPHVCTLHDVGHADGIDFLVLEHLEGQSLAERLAQGPLPLDQALHTAAQIAEGLDAAHRLGIVHRDLKPANVMLTRSGAKLLDFGLAKDAGGADATLDTVTAGGPSPTLTAEGTILGTLLYMSPEQLHGEKADARSDLFAFGLMLYEMLSGKAAFAARSRASVIASLAERSCTLHCNALQYTRRSDMEAQVTVRIPEELKRALDRAARRMQRKSSEVVRMALRAFLQETYGRDTRPADRVRGLLGSLESGVPQLAERHREYVVESLKHGR